MIHFFKTIDNSCWLKSIFPVICRRIKLSFRPIKFHESLSNVMWTPCEFTSKPRIYLLCLIINSAFCGLTHGNGAFSVWFRKLASYHAKLSLFIDKFTSSVYAKKSWTDNFDLAIIYSTIGGKTIADKLNFFWVVIELKVKLMNTRKKNQMYYVTL